MSNKSCVFVSMCMDISLDMQCNNFMIPKMGKFTTSEKALSRDECAAFGIRVSVCVKMLCIRKICPKKFHEFSMEMKRAFNNGNSRKSYRF